MQNQQHRDQCQKLNGLINKYQQPKLILEKYIENLDKLADDREKVQHLLPETMNALREVAILRKAYGLQSNNDPVTSDRGNQEHAGTPEQSFWKKVTKMILRR